MLVVICPGQVMVNEEVGLWLARLLYAHNPAKSDSAKIAGLMELFRVQVPLLIYLPTVYVLCEGETE